MGTGLFGRLQEELKARDKAAGLSMADILDLPDDLRRLLSWMVRQGEVELAEVVAYMEQGEAAAHSMLDSLVEKGFVRAMEFKNETRYRVRLAHKRGREVPLDIWQALDLKVEE